MYIPDNKSLVNFTFIDLFAGLGGFRLALESYGAKCVFSSEWDNAVAAVYETNFHDKPAGDITQINEYDIPNHDILCAGFPCQPFSISGLQKGFEDTRGTLFFDVARIIKAKLPKVVFLENVKNFASHDNGNTLLVVKNTMEELGYDFYYTILNSANFGSPQKRERCYMVGFRKDLNIKNFIFPTADLTNNLHVQDILLPDEEVKYLYKDYNISLTDISTTSENTVRLGIVGNGGQGERIYSTRGKGITLSANGGGVFAKTGGYYINGKVRRLHPRECARMDGFPDTYIIDNNPNNAYKQFGNSVVVDVLQHILKNIIKAITAD